MRMDDTCAHWVASTEQQQVLLLEVSELLANIVYLDFVDCCQRVANNLGIHAAAHLYIAVHQIVEREARAHLGKFCLEQLLECRDTQAAQVNHCAGQC